MVKKKSATALERDRERFETLKAELASVGLFRRGTMVETYRRCGKGYCACHRDPARRHGPYLLWTRKVAGKTVSRYVKQEQRALVEEWIASSRKLDRLVAELSEVSLRMTEQILEESAPGPRPRRSGVKEGGSQGSTASASGKRRVSRGEKV